MNLKVLSLWCRADWLGFLCRLRTCKSSWGTRRSRWAVWRKELSLCRQTPPTLTLLSPHWRSLLQKKWDCVVIFSGTYLFVCEGSTWNWRLYLFVGAHYRASEGAARQGWQGEDWGAGSYQKGTERDEGETEFTARRLVWQRGEKQVLVFIVSLYIDMKY